MPSAVLGKNYHGSVGVSVVLRIRAVVRLLTETRQDDQRCEQLGGGSGGMSLEHFEI